MHTARGQNFLLQRSFRFDLASLGDNLEAMNAIICHMPPWPNGQGVGLLIRRLRVRVTQGMHYIAYNFVSRNNCPPMVSRSLDCKATPRGLEPLRAEPNGFRVHLLNRSDTVSLTVWLASHQAGWNAGKEDVHG